MKEQGERDTIWTEGDLVELAPADEPIANDESYNGGGGEDEESEDEGGEDGGGEDGEE